MLLDDVRGGNWRNANGCMRRDHETARYEVTVASPENRIKHSLKEETVAHPFGDYDVDMLHGKDDFFNLTTQASIILIRYGPSKDDRGR